MTTLHYAAGGGLDSQGNFTAAQAGFNLADVSYAGQLNELPAGAQGLVWLDQYHGVTQDFIDQVTPFIGKPNLYGFYLVDEPDPTGKWGVQATAADLKAESDWIHSHVPGAKTFTVLMNMGTSDNPDYMNTYTPENTHIDLFGLDWYPVWSDHLTVDNSTIDKYVAAAQSAGISLNQIVPVYQAFGGGNWQTETGSQIVMPTADQEKQMIDHWASLVPNPAFDYAYAWGSQNGDVALESSPELQQVFLQHNTSGAMATVGSPIGSTPPVTEPVTNTNGSTLPVADTSGSTAPVADTSGSTTPVSSTDGNTTTGSNSGSPNDQTTSPTNDGSGSGHHHLGSGTPAASPADDTTGSSTSLGGSSSDPTTSTTADVRGSEHHHWGSSTPAASPASDTTGSSTSLGGSSSDPTTSTTADVRGSEHHHWGLDFSQFLGGGTSSLGSGASSWCRGHDALASLAPNTTADTSASSFADATPVHQLDLTNHNTDHHAWHW